MLFSITIWSLCNINCLTLPSLTKKAYNKKNMTNNFKRKLTENLDEQQMKKFKVDEFTESVDHSIKRIAEKSITPDPERITDSITKILLKKYTDTSKFPNGCKGVYAEFRCKGCGLFWTSNHGLIRDGKRMCQNCTRCNLPKLPYKLRHKLKNGKNE